MLPATLQFLIVLIASSINERMQKQLDYKTEEVLVLKEILRHFVFFGQRHLRHVVAEYVAHDNHERFHQGIGGRLINPAVANGNLPSNGDIQRRARLGGLLNFYYREAA